MKKRTRARELTLQFLYQLDLRGDELYAESGAWLRTEERDVETLRFATRLVEGVWENWDEIERTVQAVAQNWNIARMAVIDRNVLRLGTFELLHCPDIPPKVAVNEAIELGKRYSTANSGAFINGILDKIMNRKPAAKPEAAAQRDEQAARVAPQPEGEAELPETDERPEAARRG